MDFVGVLRELRKALQFDSSDVSGVIEDLDLLMHDFHDKIAEAKATYLDSDDGGRVAEDASSLCHRRRERRPTLGADRVHALSRSRCPEGVSSQPTRR